MAILGTGADLATDLLILGEVLISLLVLLGVLHIRRDRSRVGGHRAYMLWVLGLNTVFLVSFLVYDFAQQSNVVERSSAAPASVFWPMLTVHLVIAVTALGTAIWSWLIARKAAFRSPEGTWQLPAEARVRHRRVSRYYPWLWALTLATGLMLYGVVYVVY